MITFGSYNNFEKTLEEMRDQISIKLEKSKNVIMNDNFHNLCHSYNLYEQESGTVAILELPLPGSSTEAPPSFDLPPLKPISSPATTSFPSFGI